MVEILDALAHSHGQGVTHRAIKPSNLIMLANGRVKIADFGIARTETSELTQAGAVLGTPSYMSPEQFQGMRVDLRSDIFACGVVLYQFLTGEKPFTGHPTTIMYKVLREEPTVPSALNVSLSGVWDEVLGKALAKHLDDRFQSAGEFAAAICEALARQPSGFGQSQSHSLSAALAADGDVSRVDPEPAPAAADGVYLSSLSVAALISEGSRLYDATQYAEALAVYEAAAARPDGKHLRVYNGLYLSNIQLGRLDGAEQAFGRLVLLGLATNSLSVKFLFKPGSTDFWPDPKINTFYPMWIRVVAREAIVTRTCITVTGTPAARARTRPTSGCPWRARCPSSGGWNQRLLRCLAACRPAARVFARTW